MTGNNLSSQAASSPVLSTRESLTAVFGMGTGGSSHPSSPDLLNGLFRLLLRQAAARSVDILQYYLPSLPWPSFHKTGKSSFIFRVLTNPQNFTEETTHFTTNFISKSSPRPISTGPLNTLLNLHSRPINLVFCKGSY